jgi:hypothetical protein
VTRAAARRALLARPAWLGPIRASARERPSRLKTFFLSFAPHPRGNDPYNNKSMVCLSAPQVRAAAAPAPSAPATRPARFSLTRAPRPRRPLPRTLARHESAAAGLALSRAPPQPVPLHPSPPCPPLPAPPLPRTGLEGGLGQALGQAEPAGRHGGGRAAGAAFRCPARPSHCAPRCAHKSAPLRTCTRRALRRKRASSAPLCRADAGGALHAHRRHELRAADRQPAARLQARLARGRAGAQPHLAALLLVPRAPALARLRFGPGRQQLHEGDSRYWC